MKSVVVEKKNGYVVTLREDGTFVKMEDQNFTIGDVLNMKEKRMPGKGRFMTMLATAMIFFMLMGAGAWAYFTPYYYVSLDVNPGVNMLVNYFERVIGVEAVNEDAVAVLEGLDLKNKKVDEAITEAVESMTEEGYLSDDDGEILIASISKNNVKAERLAGKLKGAVEEEIEDNGVRAEISAGALGYEMVQQAKELNITPGKYNIITNLLGEEINDDNINESVRDLMRRYSDTKGNGVKNRNQEQEQENIAAGQDDDEDVNDDADEENEEENDEGKPEDAGKPEDTGKPDDAGNNGKKGNN